MKNYKNILNLIFPLFLIFFLSSCASIVYLNETGIYLIQEIDDVKNEDWPNLVCYKRGSITSVLHLPYFQASEFIDSLRIIGLFHSFEKPLEEIEVHECLISQNSSPKDSIVSVVKIASGNIKESISLIEKYKPDHYRVISYCSHCGSELGLDLEDINGLKLEDFTNASEFRVYDLFKNGDHYEMEYLFYFIPEDRFYYTSGDYYFYSDGSLNIGASFITKTENNEYKLCENSKVSFFESNKPLIEEGLGRDYFSTRDSVQLRVSEDAIYFISPEGEYYLCSKPKKQKVFLRNIMKTGESEYRINFVANSRGTQQSYAIYTVTGEVGKLSYPLNYMIEFANRFMQLK